MLHSVAHLGVQMAMTELTRPWRQLTLAISSHLISTEQLEAPLRDWRQAPELDLWNHVHRSGLLSEAERRLVNELCAELERRPSRIAALDRSPAADWVRSQGATPGTAGDAHSGDAQADDSQATWSASSSNSSGDPTLDPHGGPVFGQRFRRLRAFARGGLGEVLVAEDRQFGREVAVKTIREKHADDPGVRARFLREAELTGQLQHPGIPPVYALDRGSGRSPQYAMQLIEGRSLRDAVRGAQAEGDGASEASGGLSKWTQRQLIARLVSVCHTVHYAHQRGVLHRDLKPANIMLGENGQTMVVDWGLARLMGDREADSGLARTVGSDSESGATDDGALVGTRGYMSREQRLGRHNDLLPASDVYSLGATLYYILAGRTPPEPPLDDAPSPSTRGPAVRAAAPAAPLALDHVCRKAMAPLPEQRYATALELANELEAWLADEPVLAGPDRLAVRGARWVRKNRGLAAALSSGAAVLIVSLVIGAAALSRARVREQRARVAASENYRLARQALHRFLIQVGNDPLLQTHGLESLRRSLLEPARPLLERLAEQGSGGADPQLALDRAEALLSLAQLDRFLDGPRSESLYRQALAAAREGSRRPESAGAAWDLGCVARQSLADLLLRQGRLQDAEQWASSALVAAADPPLAVKPWLAARRAGEALTVRSQIRSRRGDVPAAAGDAQQAVAHARSVLRWQPQSPDAGVQLSIALLQWSDLLLAEDRTGEAEQAAIEAAALVADRREGHREQQRLYADTLVRLGSAELEQSRLAEAETHLQSATQIREQLASRYPQVPEHQRQLASIYDFRAALAGRQGRADEILQWLLKEIEQWRRLAALDPSDAEVRRRLADAVGKIADRHLERRAAVEAEAAYREAQQLWRRLAETAPAPEHPLRLAEAACGVGDALRQQGRLTEAAPLYLEAQAALARLARERPRDKDLRYHLAKAHQSLGILRRLEGDLTAAEREYRAGIQLLVELARESPRHSDFSAQLAEVRLNLGALQFLQDDNVASLATLDELVEELVDRVGPSPAAAPARQALQQAYAQRGLAHFYLQDAAAARADFSRAEPLAPLNELFGFFHAVSAALDGQPRRLESQLAMWAMWAARDGEFLFHFARGAAAARLAVLDDAATPQPAKATRADALLKACREALEKSRDAGYLKDEHLQDPLLEGLVPLPPAPPPDSKVF